MPEEVAAAAGRARATGARFWVIAQILAICAAIAALADLLLGWAGGYQVFVRIRPGYPAMVPETAVCILVLAIATLCLFRPSRSGPWQLVAQGGGVIVLLVLIAELTQPVRLSNFAPGDAMSAATTIGSLACALTLLIPLNASDRWMSIRSGLASVGACVVCIPVIGYLFNAEALFANPVYTSMALHTALGLLCVLFALVMAAPQHGWIALVLAVITGLFVALYTTYDAYGIRATADPFTFLAWFFMIDGLVFPVIAFTRWQTMPAPPAPGPLMIKGFFGGLVAFASFGAIMLATRLDKVGEAAVLRETSTVFAALIGWLVLKETVGPRRIALMALIALGAVIVEMGG